MSPRWEFEPLGQLCKTSAGGTPLKSVKEYYENGDVPWLLSGEVHQGEVNQAKNFITQKGLENSSAKLFPPNTLLIAMYGATAGAVGILRFKASTNQAICGVLPSEKFIPEFLYYYFTHKKDELVAQAAGNAQPNISQEKIRNTCIPVATLDEQRRIATLLDVAFADIATAKANAEKNLQNACELFEGYLQYIFSNPGHGWEARTLEELGTITSSKRIFKDEYVEAGIPFYRTKEIKELANGLGITTELFITESRYNEIKSGFGVPKKGDILLTAIGTIGEIWVVDGKNDFYFKDGNVLWLKNFNSVNTQFLKYVLLSFVESLKKMSHGSAYSALPIQRLNAHQIFLPTLAEQAQIVTALDELLDFSRQLESIYRQKLTALNDLKKSLLHQAFSGQL